jgi:hypothetical protein
MPTRCVRERHSWRRSPIEQLGLDRELGDEALDVAARVSIGALLLSTPLYLETAKVFDMLLAVPSTGA